MASSGSGVQRLITPAVLDSCAEKFHSRVAGPDEKGCMLWTGGVTGRGYGTFHIPRASSPTGGDVSVGAHRVAWILANRKTPRRDLVIDHLCGIQTCCNPQHLQLVRQSTNAERAPGYALGFTTAEPQPYTWLTGRVTWKVRYKQLVDGERRDRSRTFDTEAEAWAFIDDKRGVRVAPIVRAAG